MCFSVLKIFLVFVIQVEWKVAVNNCITLSGFHNTRRINFAIIIPSFQDWRIVFVLLVPSLWTLWLNLFLRWGFSTTLEELSTINNSFSITSFWKSSNPGHQDSDKKGEQPFAYKFITHTIEDGFFAALWMTFVFSSN